MASHQYYDTVSPNKSLKISYRRDVRGQEVGELWSCFERFCCKTLDGTEAFVQSVVFRSGCDSGNVTAFCRKSMAYRQGKQTWVNKAWKPRPRCLADSLATED